MKAFYELMDLDTANVVGFFATREEALAVVRAALDEHGEAGVADLALSHQDEAGNLQLIAERADLAQLARGRSLRRSA